MRIKDLDKHNLVKIRNGGKILGSIQFFATAPAASKNDTCFKSGQKWLKNSHLALLVLIRDTLCKMPHPVYTVCIRNLDLTMVNKARWLFFDNFWVVYF